jgi:beta-glucosidase
MTSVDFPFLWGAATSSHQVEGNNRHNDWWEWEQAGKLKEASGLACDHYRRFNQDFDIISELGHNAHRLSIEWSRLEPKENRWDETEFKHYEEVLKALRQRHIEPVVTLHHFTIPAWLAAQGGWTSRKVVPYFVRYVERVVSALGQYARIWITINEPTIYFYHAHLAGLWPPGGKSVKECAVVFRNMLGAHTEAYRTIHRVYKNQIGTRPWVSFSQYTTHFEPCRPDFIPDRFAAACRNWLLNDLFVDAAHNGFLFFPGFFCEFLVSRGALDFIGLNYYMQNFVRFAGLFGDKLAGDVCDDAHHADKIREKNMMGWPVAPDGLYQVLKHFRKYHLPILITENGICAADDEQRVRFIQDHLRAVQYAQADGVDVRGYFYWSLLDNFEWAHGYAPRFGIVEVDYATQERKIRRSAHVLSELCRKLICHDNRHAT